MTSDPSHIGDITNVQGDSVTASFRPESAPGLTFSSGQGYLVGQVGAYVRIPMGLVDLFAVVVQVGSSADPTKDDVADAGRPWMRLELLGEAHQDGRFERGVARFPAIGDRILLVTPADLRRIYAFDEGPNALVIGRVSNAPHLPAVVNIEKLLTRHVAIVGSTGSGKSTTVSSVVRGMSSSRYPSSRVLIIDVHGEYGRALKDEGRTLSVTSEAGEGAMWLPYWALAFDDFVELALGDIDENAATILRAYVTEEKRRYAANHPALKLLDDVISADTPLPFSVRKLWYYLHELHYATHNEAPNAQTESSRSYALDEKGNELRGDAESISPPVYLPATSGGASRIYLSGGSINMRRQTDALGARLRDPRYNFLFRPGPWDVDRRGETSKTLGDFLALWLGGSGNVVIADLSGVPDQILQRVVSVLLRLIYDALIWARQLSEGARERPLLIVLEEAHRYLNSESDAAGEIVERIVKEGRKFGVGAMIVSQRPSEIRSTVLSQIGTFFILRLTNSADRGLVRSSLPDNLAGLFDAVPVLRTGEAFVTGDATKLPTRVIFEVSESSRPDSADPKIAGRSKSGGWDRERIPEDYEDVAWVWQHLTTKSQQIVDGSILEEQTDE